MAAPAAARDLTILHPRGVVGIACCASARQVLGKLTLRLLAVLARNAYIAAEVALDAAPGL
jgi:hypothetical protein